MVKNVITIFFPFIIIADVFFMCNEPAGESYPDWEEIWETTENGDPYFGDGAGEPFSMTCVPKVYGFANNVGGYFGCTDIEIEQAFPDETIPDEVELHVDQVRDSDFPYSSESQILIRMEDVFGYEEHQIPPNAYIAKAVLTVFATADTDDEIAVHRMLADWDSNTSWNTLGGVTTNGVEAVAVADDSLSTLDADHSYSFDVTSSLAVWQKNGGERKGWVILNRGDDGWRIFSSETSLAERRPRLMVKTCGIIPNQALNLPPKVLLPIEPGGKVPNDVSSNILDVVVVDADLDPLDVTFYGREISDESWTLIVLPDTQYYTTDSKWPKGIFATQTQWIADNKEALNIQMVLSAGDIVQDASIEAHWIRADSAITTLIDAQIPYMPTPGDHDHEGQWEDGSLSPFTSTFPEARFSDNSWWGEAFDDSNSSHYILLTIGNDDYIFMGLDFCPDDDELEWANDVIEQYNDRKAIFVTHGLMDDTGDFYATRDCGRYDGDSFYIWDKFVSQHDNLYLALSGHMHRRDGEYRRTDDNINGFPVHLVTADYQARSPDSGNGLLRIMTFFPSLDEIRVQTYSPYLDVYETDSNSEFTLHFQMADDQPFEPIGAVENVSNGDHATLLWSGLRPGTSYEWYAIASDGIIDQKSPVLSFTTVEDL